MPAVCEACGAGVVPWDGVALPPGTGVSSGEVVDSDPRRVAMASTVLAAIVSKASGPVIAVGWAKLGKLQAARTEEIISIKIRMKDFFNSALREILSQVMVRLYNKRLPPEQFLKVHSYPEGLA